MATCGITMHSYSSTPGDETILQKTPLAWKVPMVISPSFPQGQFIVAAFAQSTILFSREVLTIEIAFQNENDFIRNLICLRGELRSGGWPCPFLLDMVPPVVFRLLFGFRRHLAV
jgi:hypothetical protein